MKTDDKKWMNERLNLLRQLRDEIRVDVHLAGMELKDRWQELQPQFGEAEMLARNATDSAKQRVTEIIDKFRQLRDRVRNERETHAHP
jgi:hypothetical protein